MKVDKNHIKIQKRENENIKIKQIQNINKHESI